MAYEKIGNIPKGFYSEQRYVKPVGLINDTPDSDLVLKAYSMFKLRHPLSEKHISGAMSILDELARKSLIPRASGMGYAVISDDTINSEVWKIDSGKTASILTSQTLLEYPPPTSYPFEFLDIRREGSHCIWEKAIANAEAGFWLIYQRSKRTEEDKIKYLHTTLEGLLFPHVV